MGPKWRFLLHLLDKESRGTKGSYEIIVCVCVCVCVHLQEPGGKALIHIILAATGSYVHDITSGSTVNILKGNFKSQR